MKKLTTSVLAVVLTGSFSLVSAQKDSVKTQDIEGVVVTALGIKREEKTLPYASQTVKAKELNVAQTVDVKGAIAGKIAGVQLNSQAGSKLGETGKLRLRGAISLLDDQDAIYVVDGVIVDPNSIDPDNIETLNVLKGPNATALYGQRAQYGVVVMTLKKGIKNRVNVELNSTTNVDMIARTMKYQNLYGQGYEGDESLQTFVFDPSYHPADWAIFDGMRYKYGDNNLADESWGAKFDGKDYIPWYAWWKDSPYYGQTAKYEAQPNNIRDFYDKAMTYKNTVSIAGGNDTYTARLSFTNLNQNGITPFTWLRRNYVNFNGSFNLSERLTIDGVMNYVSGRTKGEFDDGYGNQTSGSFNSWFARDLDMAKMKELKDLQTPLGYSASWNWWGPDYYGDGGFFTKPAFWLNPYFYMENFQQYRDRNNTLYSVAPTYKVNDNFSLRASFSRRNDRTGFSEYMPYIIAKSASGREGGYIDFLNGFGLSDSNYVEDNYDLRGNYKTKLGDFDLNAMLGGGIQKSHWFGNSTRMDLFGRLTYLLIPDVYDFKNASVAPTPEPWDYMKQVKSLYATASLGYKDFLYVDLTGRNDINSAFLDGNNSFFTYSLGASLLLHSLMQKNDALTFFKIRAGIAQIASDLSATVSNPEYRYSAQPYRRGNLQYLVANPPTLYVDPGLSPAINNNFEAGVDMKFIKNRVSFSATYYDEKRNQEPIPVSTPSSSGALATLINSGDVNRKGIELSLSGDVFKNADGFNWTTSANFAKNKTMVTHIAEDLDALSFSTVNGQAPAFGYISIVQKEGMEWGQLVGTGFLRDANGNKVINDDGTYAVKQNVFFGSVLPKFNGGFYNSFGYKGVTLSATIDFQKGGKFFSLSEQWGNSSGLLEETAAMNDRGFNVRDAVDDGGGVHVIGVDAAGAPVDKYVDAYTYFTQFHGNRLAEQYVHDASYIKLREVALSYALPKSVFSGSKIEGITIGLVARNPWLISVAKDNIHRWDPSEMSESYGEDGQLPSTRGFGMNVKINF